MSKACPGSLCTSLLPHQLNSIVPPPLRPRHRRDRRRPLQRARLPRRGGKLPRLRRRALRRAPLRPRARHGAGDGDRESPRHGMARARLSSKTPPAPGCLAKVFPRWRWDGPPCGRRVTLTLRLRFLRRIHGARVADLLAQVAKGESAETASAIAGAKRLVDMGAQCSLAQLLQTARRAALSSASLACLTAPALHRSLFLTANCVSCIGRVSCTRTLTAATCSSRRTGGSAIWISGS